jgi:hypothetical protein
MYGMDIQTRREQTILDLLSMDGRMILKCILNALWVYGLDSSFPGYEAVTDSFERSNKRR